MAYEETRCIHQQEKDWYPQFNGNSDIAFMDQAIDIVGMGTLIFVRQLLDEREEQNVPGLLLIWFQITNNYTQWFFGTSR